MVERQQKEVPEIPGVERGSDFMRMKKIEQAGAGWAETRRSNYMSEALDVMIISRDKQNFFDLPIVGNRDQKEPNLPFWTPRVHPITGAIVITRWDKLKQNEFNFEEDIVFGGKKKDEVLKLDKYPKSWKIARLIPMTIPDGIEAAMRQQDEIIHDYSEQGVEKGRVEEVFSKVNILSEAFINGEIKTQADVVTISKEAQDLLFDNGLLNPRNKAWETVAEKIKRAASRDSINRINPMISRVVLRSTYLEAVINEVRGPGIKDKAKKIYSWLEGERVFVRSQIENVAIALEQMIGCNKFRGLDIFEKPNSIYLEIDYWEVGQLLKAISDEVLVKVQVAPYLGTVSIVRKLLTGSNFKNAKEEGVLNKRLEYIKDPGLRKEQSAEDLLRIHATQSARNRIKYAHGLLKALLNDPDYKVTTTF
jgi:hypothetical protein